MDIKETTDYDQFELANPQQREDYLISKALYSSMKSLLLKEVESVHKEWSDICRMRDLLTEKYRDYIPEAKLRDPDYKDVMKAARRPPDLTVVK